MFFDLSKLSRKKLKVLVFGFTKSCDLTLNNNMSYLYFRVWSVLTFQFKFHVKLYIFRHQVFCRSIHTVKIIKNYLVLNYCNFSLNSQT
jgi:hypothetical protein